MVASLTVPSLPWVVSGAVSEGTGAREGWYADPRGTGDQRWWDGREWTDRTRPPSPSADWRSWIARSPRARTFDQLVAGAAGLSALVAFLIGLTALIRDKPLPGVAILVLPAVPILLAGQLWTIALVNARTPRHGGSWREQMRATRALRRDSRKFFFGELDAKLARLLLALAFLGWLSAMSAAFSGLSAGGPTGPGDGCRYRLDDHGRYPCVSRQAYEHAGAVQQRFASGVLLGFFAMHTGAALGGLRTRNGVSQR